MMHQIAQPGRIPSARICHLKIPHFFLAPHYRLHSISFIGSTLPAARTCKPMVVLALSQQAVGIPWALLLGHSLVQHVPI